MAVSLVMFTKGGERRDFEIRDGKAIIGRTTDCDIQIGLGVVSRRHCEISVKGEKVAVKDLGSSNGTYVNNRRVQLAEAAAGETITVGPVIFTVVVNGKPEQVKPIRTMVGKSGAGKSSKGAGGKPAETEPALDAAVAESKKPTGEIKLDDTGSVDLSLEDSAELEIFGGSSVAGENPLAELEAISKQKRASS